MRKKVSFLAIILIGLLFSSCASTIRVFDYRDITSIKRLEKENPKEFVEGPLWYVIIEKERKEWKKEIKKIAEEYQISILQIQSIFINYIWEKRDTSSSDSEKQNKFRENFYRNLIYVETNFRNPGKGWKDDRGEIYLTLGPPENRSSITVSHHAYDYLTNNLPDVADALGIKHELFVEVEEWIYNNFDYDAALYGLEVVYPASIYFRNGNSGWELAIKINASEAGRLWGIYEDLYIPAKRNRWFSIYSELQRILEEIKQSYIYDEEMTLRDYILEKEVKWVPVNKKK